MPCPPGLRVPRQFYWGHAEPCTQPDPGNQCDVIRRNPPVASTTTTAPQTDAIALEYAGVKTGNQQMYDTQAGFRTSAHAQKEERGSVYRLDTLHGMGGHGSTGKAYYSNTVALRRRSRHGRGHGVSRGGRRRLVARVNKLAQQRIKDGVNGTDGLHIQTGDSVGFELSRHSNENT